MKGLEEEMNVFFYKWDNANGEEELKKVSDEMNLFIEKLMDKKQKEKAKQAFKFYFAKRLARLEDDIQNLKFHKANSYQT